MGTRVDYRVAIGLGLAIAAATGCYDVPHANCQYTCGTSLMCPAPLECDNGYCHAPGGASCESADARTADAIENCPSAPVGCDVAVLIGHCYSRCQINLAWVPASMMCETAGWQLAELVDLAEADAVVPQLFPADTTPVWVGAAQASSANGIADGWTWVNAGVAVAPARWLGGDPDDADDFEDGDEQCGAANVDAAIQSTMADFRCGDTYEWICEWPR